LMEGAGPLKCSLASRKTCSSALNSVTR
jgi:hypothetical protein